MEILGKMIGSLARVKIMRLFMLNTGKFFSPSEVSKRSRVSIDIVRKEIKLLESINFIKRKNTDFAFNTNFKYREEIEGLLITSDSFEKNTVLEKFNKAGRIKLLVISGIFIKNKDSRVDVLIVGDNLKRKKIDDGIKKLEAEIGTELVYAIFNTKEFDYRIKMYDKLVRDILDFPHEIIIQSKELSTQILKKL